MKDTIKNLISVIVPTYNPELQHFTACLQSIYAQTGVEIECIIVDDGSVVPVTEMVAHMQLQVAPKIISQKNSGAPHARNVGAQHARGEYIIFWDDDIVAQSDMLKKMQDVLEKNPTKSFAYSSFYFGRKKMKGIPFDVKVLTDHNFIMTTSLIRKEVFPLFDESLKRFQDWDLWLTLAKQGKEGIYIDEFLFRAMPKKFGIGISSWLPSFAYKKPWSSLPFFKKRVAAYNEAKAILVRKHQL